MVHCTLTLTDADHDNEDDASEDGDSDGEHLQKKRAYVVVKKTITTARLS